MNKNFWSFRAYNDIIPEYKFVSKFENSCFEFVTFYIIIKKTVNVVEWRRQNGTGQFLTMTMRTFWDLQHNQDIENDAEWQKNMMQIEMRVSETEAFRAVAFFHHIIFSK